MAKNLGDVEALAKKYDARGIDVELLDLTANSFTLRALADKEKIDIVVLGKDLSSSGNENIVTLYGTEVGDGSDEKGVGGKVEVLTQRC